MERIETVEDLENIRDLKEGEYYQLCWSADDKAFTMTRDKAKLLNWYMPIRLKQCYVTIITIVEGW